MVKLTKYSGSIRDQRQSSLNTIDPIPSISRTVEEQITCNSGAPPQAGSNSSCIRIITSSMFKTWKCLMSKATKTKKHNPSSCMEDTMVPTSDGRLSILTLWRRDQPRDLTGTSDSISIDHSSLCLGYQWEESLKLPVPMLSLGPIILAERHRGGNSTKRQRPSGLSITETETSR